MNIFSTTSHHTAQKKSADGIELQIFISILSAIFKEEKELLDTITCSMQALEELERGQKATDYLETMVRYIINARDDMSYTDMHEAVKNVSPKGGELLMTIAEKLRNDPHCTTSVSRRQGSRRCHEADRAGTRQAFENTRAGFYSLLRNNCHQPRQAADSDRLQGMV